ncbi:MAG TPA: GTPase Era [Candidatus Omnitrophota bacterium]|nr:GTPase Era [Candidatus Omnitrophota bacterium]
MSENKKDNDNFKSGIVTIIGRPNVGKSTLLNRILNTKVAIVSQVPQTTRNQIRGIYNDARGQIVFIDTPGIHFGRDNLDKLMNESSRMTIDDADCIIYLADVSRRTGEEEKAVVERLKNVKGHIIMGLNKVDLGASRIPEYISLWENTKGCSVNELKNFTLLPLAGERGTNVDKLIDIIFDLLPMGPALYPPDMVTDLPQRIAIAEIIREKLFMLMREEVPHSIGVVVEAMQAKKNIIHIKALIYVEREAHKEIVIGKGGQVLKTVGTQAREELERLLQSKIFLELTVKTKESWRDDLSILAELGYTHS